jgi:hypothetical protein
VAEHARFLLREHHNAPGAIGKSLEHETPLDCELTSSLKVTESPRYVLSNSGLIAGVPVFATGEVRPPSVGQYPVDHARECFGHGSRRPCGRSRSGSLPHFFVSDEVSDGTPDHIAQVVG